MANCLIAALLAFAISLSAAWGEDSKPAVSLLTLEWEPYIGEKLPCHGYVAELVEASLAASGKRADFKFLPWAKAVELAKSGSADGYLPEYYDDARRSDFLFSDSFPGGHLVLFKRKGVDLTFSGDIEALRGLKTGVVRGYVNTKAIDESTTLLKEEAPSDEANLRKLAAGRLDVIVIDRLVAETLLREDGLKALAGNVELVSPALEYKPLYICFSKAKPESKALLSAFNSGLSKLKSSGDLDRILAKHGIPEPPKR